MCFFRRIPDPSLEEMALKAEIESTIGTALGQNPDVVHLHQQYAKMKARRIYGHNRILLPLPEPPPEAHSWREDYTGKLED